MSKIPNTFPPDPKQNQILGVLPKEDFERLLPDLELVELTLGCVISEAGEDVDYLHFPISGIVSLILTLEDGSSSEVAVVGNEGMVGISIFMGGECVPGSMVVQTAGAAYRLNRKVMKREFALGGKLQRLALLFTHALICQTSQTAVCTRHHTLDQQLCRWLLMSADRLHEDEVKITQEMLAELLGVRRESISLTARQLETDGLIARTRGHISLVNRAGIEKHVCECYGVVEHEYERLLPYRARGKLAA